MDYYNPCGLLIYSIRLRSALNFASVLVAAEAAAAITVAAAVEAAATVAVL